MEFLIVFGLLGVLLLFATGNALLVWLGVLAALLIVGYRAYRIRCPSCHRSVISGRFMRFCNQCGGKQERPGGLRFLCESCRRLARSELNLNYCNRCGARL